MRSRTIGYIVEESRGAARQSVSMEAIGILPYIDQAINCEILDISETGAQIEIKNVDVIPDKFRLFVPETHSFNKCRTVWRNGNRIGVAFKSKLSLGDAQAD